MKDSCVVCIEKDLTSGSDKYIETALTNIILKGILNLIQAKSSNVGI